MQIAVCLPMGTEMGDVPRRMPAEGTTVTLASGQSVVAVERTRTQSPTHRWQVAAQREGGEHLAARKPLRSHRSTVGPRQRYEADAPCSISTGASIHLVSDELGNP